LIQNLCQTDYIYIYTYIYKVTGLYRPTPGKCTSKAHRKAYTWKQFIKITRKSMVGESPTIQK